MNHVPTWPEIVAVELAAAMAKANDPGPVLCELPPLLEHDVGWDDRRAASTFWTAARVYFPACYDGGLWVASAPRDPCDERVRPIGGGGY